MANRSANMGPNSWNVRPTVGAMIYESAKIPLVITRITFDGYAPYRWAVEDAQTKPSVKRAIEQEDSHFGAREIRIDAIGVDAKGRVVTVNDVDAERFKSFDLLVEGFRKSYETHAALAERLRQSGVAPITQESQE